MKTSYFWKATHEPVSDVKYVSISRSTPPGVQYMLSYESLMPSWDLVKLAHDQDLSQESFEYFRKAYYSQLDKLNPEKVYEDLKDCTLVCFESSKDLATKKKFCHRRMVAGWIEEQLGIIVPEETREKEKDLIVPVIYRS